MVYIIRLRQISTGLEADSMLFRGTLDQARAHAEFGISGHVGWSYQVRGQAGSG